MTRAAFATRAAAMSRRAAARAACAGFTLIEMVITIMLAGVLTTMALPYYRNLILNQSVKTAASDLQIAFLFARSEALKRGADILVVPGSSDWKNGWSVQLADTTVVRSQPALNPQLASIAGTTVTYGSDGHVSAAPGPLVFRVSGNRAVTARCVVLDLSGRPSIVSDTDRDPSNGCN